MSSEFIKHVKNGDLDNVKKCIEKYRIDPSRDDNWAIRESSFSGHLDIIKYLISLDEKYNIDPSANNNISICYASANGHLEVVKYLMSLDIKYNIDPSAYNNQPIRLASKNGHLNIVKYLMSLDKKYKIDPSAEGNDAICLASENGQFEVVKYLMSLPKKYKINPSAINLPILWASQHGYFNIVKLLSTNYYSKLPLNEIYNEDINNYIQEFNKNPLEMNKKMKSYYFNNDLKYYSLTILFNDEYLTLEDNCDNDVKKLFNITKELNNDILMLLINILTEQNKTIISSNNFNSFLKENINREWLFNDNKK